MIEVRITGKIWTFKVKIITWVVKCGGDDDDGDDGSVWDDDDDNDVINDKSNTKTEYGIPLVTYANHRHHQFFKLKKFLSFPSQGVCDDDDDKLT